MADNTPHFRLKFTTDGDGEATIVHPHQDGLMLMGVALRYAEEADSGSSNPSVSINVRVAGGIGSNADNDVDIEVWSDGDVTPDGSLAASGIWGLMPAGQVIVYVTNADPDEDYELACWCAPVEPVEHRFELIADGGGNLGPADEDAATRWALPACVVMAAWAESQDTGSGLVSITMQVARNAWPSFESVEDGQDEVLDSTVGLNQSAEGGPTDLWESVSGGTVTITGAGMLFPGTRVTLVVVTIPS